MSDAETARFVIGEMYRVPWSPNPHKLEAIKPQHCQLHGDFIGYHLHLRKKRNSTVRPWGCVSVANPIDAIQPWGDA